ncbi:MAG: T9SS type A sorting domain-containing protein [Bacteroidota bacterium]
MEDEGYSVEQTNDGGYILSGYTRSFPGAGNADAYLIKTDANGDTLWTKLYGSQPHDKGFYVHQTADSGYVIGGVCEGVAGFNDLFLTKINSVGDTLWTKVHAYNYYSDANDFQQTNDGGCIVTGDWALGSGNYNVYLFKADSNGNKLWAKNYGGSSNDEGYNVRQTSDSGYIIIGRTASFGAGSEDVYLIKTNSVGDTLWTKTYGGTGSDEGFSIVQTNDGGYLFTGRTATFGAGGDVYLVKTDANGIVTWSKNFGGQYGDCGNSIQKTNDGGYVIGGYYNLGSATSAYLIKLDSTGSSNCGEVGNATITTTPPTQVADAITTLHTNLLSRNNTTTVIGSGVDTSTICFACNLTVSFSGLPDTICFNASPITLNGNPAGGVFTGFGITGTTFNPAVSSLGDQIIVYTYSLSSACFGSDTSSIFVRNCVNSTNNLNDESALVIYPNPVDKYLVIKNSFPGNETVTVKFFDVAGREIFSSQIKTSNQKLETRNLENGIYFCQIKSNDKIFNQKFIVQH